MINYSAEDRLIFLFSRTSPKEDSRKEVEELLKNNLDWQKIFRKSELNGTSQLLYFYLNSLEEEGLHLLPGSILKQFKDSYYENCARNILIYDELTRILGGFNERGIEAIPLKGVALAKNVYQNIALRPTTDIDILIRKSELSRVNRVLNLLGYPSPLNYTDSLKNSSISSSLNSFLYKRQHSPCFSVHLHWHLINSTWPLHSYVAKIDMHRIWSQAERVDLDGIETLLLAPCHLLIYLSAHAFNHSFDRLILFSDILEVVRHYGHQLDWSLFLEETMRFNLKQFVYYALYFSSELLKARVPPAVIEKLKPDKFNFVERRFCSLVLHNFRFRCLSYFIYLSMQGSPAKKIRFLRKTLFPPPQVIAHNRMIDLAEVKPVHYLLRFIRK